MVTPSVDAFHPSNSHRCDLDKLRAKARLVRLSEGFPDFLKKDVGPGQAPLRARGLVRDLGNQRVEFGALAPGSVQVILLTEARVLAHALLQERSDYVGPHDWPVRLVPAAIVAAVQANMTECL